MDTSLIIAVMRLIKEFGLGELFGLLAVITLFPWIALIWVNYQHIKRSDRLEKMIESNKDEFRESLQKVISLSENYAELSKNLQNLIITNIEVMTQIKDMIKFLINNKR